MGFQQHAIRGSPRHAAPHLVQPFFGLRHAGGFVDRELLLQLEMAGKSADQNWEKHERKSTSKKRITFFWSAPKNGGKTI
jgi:hypothetical protein